MPRDEAGSVRFEKTTTVKMIHLEPWNNSNDVNGGKDYRTRDVILAESTEVLLAGAVSAAIKETLA